MSEYFSNVSEKVQNHLKQLSGSVKFIENPEEPLEQLAKVWLEKEELFNEKLEKNEFEPVDTLSADEERGALIMTYSGSLLSIGPAGDDGRKVEYSSVGFRTDVPDGLEQDDAVLEGDIEIDAPVKFKDGPLQQSSPVYKLALVKESLDDEEAEELLAEMTQMLSDEFVEINKTIIQD
ncbi:hypothetical protein [Breznakiella homolactica]|uniref:Uncharacterized protein n=1 Tax=Breznakiella homolactica TaxID=2798577 RepID=A0A7T8BBC6_9SPIR|nr:hypothetical protein [Breznakiella homolactica]QQO10266.1 hypothetical protein JFL75_04925 [Breznakiella homolactica]